MASWRRESSGHPDSTEDAREIGSIIDYRRVRAQRLRDLPDALRTLLQEHTQDEGLGLVALPSDDAQQSREVLPDQVGGVVHPFTLTLLVSSNNLRGSSMLFGEGGPQRESG